VRRHLRKALAVLAFVTGIAGGSGLYVGVDGYYLTVASSHQSAGSAVQPLNGNPRLPLKTVPIPVASLQPALAETLGRSKGSNNGTIEGYVLRSAWNTSTPICLGAENTGEMAGKNRDPVMVSRCSKIADSDIWIPVQWEANGDKFTQLVNYQYQSKCLNAINTGGLANGHSVRLWECYNSPSQFWDFGDWRHNMIAGISPYPLFLESGRLCLDADKYALSTGVGAPVGIWEYYTTSNQYWF
jgi:hypothetical protein